MKTDVGALEYGTFGPAIKTAEVVEPAPKLVFGLCRESLLFWLFLSMYVSYLVFGAAVFAAFEAPQELAIRESLLRSKISFLQRFSCVRDDELEGLIVEIVKANNRGVSATRNVSGEPNWSFGQSLFFSSTVITTIGYGHVTPLSRAGKVFCMAYALVGIPLTLVLLSALVDRLSGPTGRYLNWLHGKLSHLYSPLTVRLVHLASVTAILTCVFLLAPAGAFAYLEPEWDYLDSFYYCFISLTTIGLGDYIPGDSPDQPNRPLYKVLTTCYLFAGITFMMLTLTVFYEIPQLNLGALLSARGKTDEKLRLSRDPPVLYGLDGDETTRIVRVVKSRQDDSPTSTSPDNDDG